MREPLDYAPEDRGCRRVRRAQRRSRRGGEGGGAADTGRLAQRGACRGVDRVLQPMAVTAKGTALDRLRGRAAAAADRQALQAPLARPLLGQQDVKDRVKARRLHGTLAM